MRTAFLLLIFLWSALFSVAQTPVIQLTPHVGYSTASGLQMYYGKVRTLDNWNFGGSLAVGSGRRGAGFSRNAFIEIQYNYLNTDLRYRYYDFIFKEEHIGQIEVHNILVGSIKETGSTRATGYFGSYVGLTVFNPSRPQYNDYTRFTLSFAGGLKYALSARAGLRLHSQLYLPFWDESFYIGWSPGGGTSAGISSARVNVYATFNLGAYINLTTDNGDF